MELLLVIFLEYGILPFFHSNTEVMMQKRYKVTLSSAERQQLLEITRSGKHAAAKIKHANILLAVDESDHPCPSDTDIAKQLHCHFNTIANIRQLFVENGFEAALERKKQEKPSIEPMFDGRAEAHLIATACSTPPEGRCRWTLQLLADKMVALEIVEKTSCETIRRVLKKTSLSLI
jgi:hypothetical protein